MTIAASEFGRLVREHQRMVYSIALRMLGDTGLAEELAQDVFLELHGAMRRMESEEYLRFWLRRVAMCRALDALRRRRSRGLELVTEAWDDERHGAAGLRAAELRETGEERMSERLEEMVMALPASYRAAVVLRYGEEMSPEEVAAALRRPVATVKSDLRRGLEMLRRKAGAVLREYVRG